MHTFLLISFSLLVLVCDCFAGVNESRRTLGIHPDSLQSEVTLRYDISPGDHYYYKLVTDQVVVNNHSTRLQTTFEVRALSRDVRGNTRCRIKLSSDPVRDSSKLHGTDAKMKRFAGYRSWVQEQAYEACLLYTSDAADE